MSAPQRIVVVRLDRVGDMILGANLLVELERHYPETEIVVFCRPEVVSLKELLPSRIVWRPVQLQIDGQLSADYVHGHVLKFLDEFHNFAHEIFIVASYQRVWLDGLMCAVTKAPHRLGFASDSPLTAGFDEIVEIFGFGQRPDFTAVVECEASATEMEKARRLTELAVHRGVKLRRPEVRVPAAALETGGRLASMLFGHTPAAQRLLIWPGSSEGLRKSLPVQTWREVLRALASDRFETAMLGGPADAETLERLRNELGRERGLRFHQFGPEELPALAGLCDHVRALISTDSGPAHLAQAVGCPTCVLMGGGTWPRFNPLFGPASLVTVPVRCRGCNWICPFDSYLCVSMIRSQDLLPALEWLFKQPRTRDLVREFAVQRDDITWLHDATAAGLRYVHLLQQAHRMHEDQMRLHRRLQILSSRESPPPTEKRAE